MGLPTDAKARKDVPLFSGFVKYFPDAMAAVAEVSRIGNEQHNPGQPLHWARGKSQDHGDALLRHQVDAGTFDTDGVRHSAKVAWRAMAQLQEEIERDTPKTTILVKPGLPMTLQNVTEPAEPRCGCQFCSTLRPAPVAGYGKR